MNKFESNWTGERNLSIDGTGVLPSVDEKVALHILNYIKQNYNDVNKILDIGAGRGFFQKTVEENSNILVWSIEGYGQMPFEANKERLIVSDATIPFTKEYKKEFDLVTSFECIEHIHSTGQENFWKNVFYASDKALVGIHCLNQEDEQHCFIRNKEWWCNFFEENSINYELIGEPNNLWDMWPQANCSLFFKLSMVSK
jgi:hypothetical protein